MLVESSIALGRESWKKSSGPRKKVTNPIRVLLRDIAANFQQQRRPAIHFIVGIAKSGSPDGPAGQRAVTDFMRV